MDDPNCQTIQLIGGIYQESLSIQRDVTIGTPEQGSAEPHVGLSRFGVSVFTIFPGSIVTPEGFHIDSGGGGENGGGIFNQGTLVLNGMLVHGNTATYGAGIHNEWTLTLKGGSVYENTATNDGGGIYNRGSLYLCDSATVTENEAPPGTENDISGTPAQDYPTSSRPGGPPREGTWYS